MKQFTVNGQEYVGISLPDGANTFIVENPTTDPDTLLFWSDEQGNDDNMLRLPRGEYEIVGTMKDLHTTKGMEGYHSVEQTRWRNAQQDHNLTDSTLILKKK